MVEADLDGRSVGIVDCAVGAPYAVLVAEQMFALGCELLLSITSSGQVAALGPTPYFVLTDRALRDEGTSHHYAPPAEFAEADATLVPTAEHALAAAGFRIPRGATWTTDAPFRETSAAIAAARAKGILAVEMEAAALYAFAQSRGIRVLCFAHVTNCMGQSALDFEKGEAQGVIEALRILSVVAWRLYETGSDSEPEQVIAEGLGGTPGRHVPFVPRFDEHEGASENRAEAVCIVPNDRQAAAWVPSGRGHAPAGRSRAGDPAPSGESPARSLFKASSETLLTIAADPKHLGARVGITAAEDRARQGAQGSLRDALARHALGVNV